MITFSYQLPYNITAGTVTQLASARPFNADDRHRQQRRRREQRPAGRQRRGASASRRSAARGTQDVGAVRRGPDQAGQRQTILLRLEGFNLFNHGNILGRAQTTYGDTATVNPTFGQLVAVGTATNALPALANIDPPRMFQFQVRYIF